jgi:hypothetical protein
MINRYNIGKIFPPGHFYSPIPDLNEIKAREEKIFRIRKEEEILGFKIDKKILLTHLEYINRNKHLFNFPDEASEDFPIFYTKNGMFGGLDAYAYFSFLLHYRPNMVIEVGCGYSSLLSMYVNKNHFQDKIKLLFIEPYPSELLNKGIAYYKNAELIQEKVQDVDITIFTELKQNDILFIDSSHVSKIGSDVNHIIFEILPRLNSGVIIHFHDIFIPDEYPKKWVFEENRAWNEMYILKAFLMYNSVFSIIFSSYYASTRLKEHILQIFDKLISGGSIYIRKNFKRRCM